jgi:EmrB/QacA subfamily drug resistance transporter
MPNSTTSVRHPRRGWTLALTSVAFFMTALDVLVVTVALPSIQRDLHSGVSTLEWTVNAYNLTFAAGIIPAAALGDRLGRRKVFVSGIALFTAASACCALAPTAGLLLSARAVQGVGAAAIVPLGLTILTAAFPPERRGAIVGGWGGIAGLAVASGPLIGGAVTQGIDWHWIFWINVPIGIAAVPLSRLLLRESRGPARRLDLPGVSLISAGVFALVWGLMRGNAAGWGSAELLITLAAGVALIAAFGAWERRAPEPMLPPRLFRNRTFVAANGTAFLMIAALYGAVFLVSQYFQFVLGNSPLGTGLRVLPWTATPILVAPAAGMLSDRIGARPVMLTGMLLQGLGLGWFAVTATTGTAFGSLIASEIIAGVGVSMALPATTSASLGAVAPSEMGKASGVNRTLQQFGGVFGIAIASVVFAANGHLGTATSVNAGFGSALAVCAGFSLLGTAVALGVGAKRRAARQADPAITPQAAVATTAATEVESR